MYQVDLNSDLGESFGRYTIGMDEKIIPLISSANIACGFFVFDFVFFFVFFANPSPAPKRLVSRSERIRDFRI